MRTRQVKTMTVGEKKIYDLYSNKNYWIPMSERDLAKIIGFNHSYISRVKKFLFIKGYLDEYGRPTKKVEEDDYFPEKTYSP